MKPRHPTPCACKSGTGSCAIYPHRAPHPAPTGGQSKFSGLGSDVRWKPAGSQNRLGNRVAPLPRGICLEQDVKLLRGPHALGGLSLAVSNNCLGHKPYYWGVLIHYEHTWRPNAFRKRRMRTEQQGGEKPPFLLI